MNKILWLIFGLLIVNINRFLEPRVAIESFVETGGGDVVRQIAYFSIFCFTTKIYLNKSRHTSTGLLMPLPMIILFSWAAITVFWSVVPDIAIRRLLLTLLVAVIILQISAVVEIQIIMMRLRQVIFILSLISLFVVILFPSLGIHQLDDPETSVVGNWRGVFYHKNIFGSVLAAGVILTIYSTCFSIGYRRNYYLAQTLFLIYLLIMSGSKTSTGILILCGLIMVALLKISLFRNNKKKFFLFSVFIIVFVGLIVALIFIQQSSNEWLTDDSFTGRGLIWISLLSMVEDHWWTGFGFQSIFQIGVKSPLDYVFGGNLFLTTLSHSHNLYIEMLVSMGVIGLSIFIFVIIIYPIFQVANANGTKRNIRYLCFTLMLFTWLHGLLEVGVFDRDRIDWVIFLTAFSVLQRIQR